MDLFQWFPTPGRLLRQNLRGEAALGSVRTYTGSFGGAAYRVVGDVWDEVAQPNTTLVLFPRGTGAFVLGPPPDSGTAGGARGARAVDLNLLKLGAQYVAAGDDSFAGIGALVSGLRGVGIGYAATVTAPNAAVIAGHGGMASGTYAFVGGGYASSASGQGSFFLAGQGAATAKYAGGTGEALADKQGQFAVASNAFATPGDAQTSTMVARRSTTDATPTELFLDGSSARLTIPQNCSCLIEFACVARTSTAAGTIESASFLRRALFTRGSAASTTTKVAESVVGTDAASAGAAAWAFTLTADTTNGSAKMEGTGAAATNIRWVVSARMTQVIYA